PRDDADVTDTPEAEGLAGRDDGQSPPQARLRPPAGNEQDRQRQRQGQPRPAAEEPAPEAHDGAWIRLLDGAFGGFRGHRGAAKYSSGLFRLGTAWEPWL